MGALIFNQGNTTDPFHNDATGATLTEFYTGGIPVLYLSCGLGETLAGITWLPADSSLSLLTLFRQNGKVS